MTTNSGEIKVPKIAKGRPRSDATTQHRSSASGRSNDVIMNQVGITSCQMARSVQGIDDDLAACLCSIDTGKAADQVLLSLSLGNSPWCMEQPSDPISSFEHDAPHLVLICRGILRYTGETPRNDGGGSGQSRQEEEDGDWRCPPSPPWKPRILAVVLPKVRRSEENLSRRCSSAPPRERTVIAARTDRAAWRRFTPTLATRGHHAAHGHRPSTTSSCAWITRVSWTPWRCPRP